MEGSFNPVLVALSCIVSVMVSWTVLNLAERARDCHNVKTARYWLVGGAFPLGIGLWGGHFISIFSFQLPVPFGYDAFWVTLSLLISIVGSGLALALIQNSKLTGLRLVAGGVMMGACLSAMHFTGMAAIKIEPAIRHDALLSIFSTLAAVLVATFVLWVTFRFSLQGYSSRKRPVRWLRPVVAAGMGIAIVSMDYSAMAATQFVPGARGIAIAPSPLYLAGLVALISLAVMVATLLFSSYDARQGDAKDDLRESLQVANQELQSLMFHDQLTRLPNRLLLEDRIQQIMARANRENLEFALFFIDLDRFKSVNDTLGHHGGDALIGQVARRLQETLREMDTVARVGGDEFMVVLSESNKADAVKSAAKRISNTVSTAFNIDGNEVRITASIGISIYPRHGKGIHELMMHADAAMYYAKDIGKNNYQVFEPGMQVVMERRSIIVRNLTKALDKSALTLVYQPIVKVADNSVSGAEALLRWYDDELGMVRPDEFIPIAEDAGLIVPLGEWVLREACQQIKSWHDQGFGAVQSLAVNVSAYQLNHKNFPDVVKAVLGETGLAQGCLELEITESAIMHNPERANMILTDLHNIGVRISIDDFGTGYSNLSKLKSFPIDTLKIDRSFVSGIPTDDQDIAITRAIIALADSLNLDVVAEGVETQEQLAFIQHLKARHYQGYFFCKPVPADELKRSVLVKAADLEGASPVNTGLYNS